MDNSNINKDKYKYRRPGVIEGESSKIGSGDDEIDRAAGDGPYKGDQSARGLDSKQKARGGDDGQEQFRVVITREANDCLGEAASKVNLGFEAGAVSRSDIANYVFKNLSRHFNDADVKALRTLHFDDKKVLGSILKSDEALPEEIRRALREHYGISEKEKKRTLRAAQEPSANGPAEKSSA